jgi:hypothetical protein
MLKLFVKQSMSQKHDLSVLKVKRNKPTFIHIRQGAIKDG